jgi:hypothetical protein
MTFDSMTTACSYDKERLGAERSLPATHARPGTGREYTPTGRITYESEVGHLASEERLLNELVSVMLAMF